MDLLKLTALELGEKIKAKEVTVREAVDAVIGQIKEAESEIHSFVTIDEEGAYAQAEEIQKKIDVGELTGPLAGVPVAVKDNMCIFLDASSTAYTLGMKLTGFTELTVITNGINLALALKDVPGITVILTGGIVTSASSSIEGLLGEDLLKKIHTDIAFVSARGFSVENGLTDFSIYEADLKRMCIKASAKTIALIDHTKFDTSSISSYASIDDLHLVITDAGLSQNTKEIYEKAGIDLIVAE